LGIRDSKALPLTVGCGTIIALSLVVVEDPPGWVGVLAMSLLTIPTLGLLLYELSRLVEKDDSSLRSFRDLVFGAGKGFGISGYILVLMFFVKLLFSRGQPLPIISMNTLFTLAILAFVLAFLCDTVGSAFDFRLWAGARRLEDLRIEDLFQTFEWSGRWQRRSNFKDSFWRLVPFFIRDKKEVRSIPVLDWRTITFLALVIIFALFQGFQSWTQPFVAASIFLVCYVGAFFQSYKKALNPYDGTKLRELRKKIDVARSEWAYEMQEKYHGRTRTPANSQDE